MADQTPDPYGNFNPKMQPGQGQQPDNPFQRSKLNINTNLFDAMGKRLINKAKEDPNKAHAMIQDWSKLKMHVEVDLEKTDKGNVIFVQHLITENRDTHRRMTILDWGWDLKGMINYVQQMIDYQREEWPQWAKDYYNARTHCPGCLEKALFETTGGIIWESQDPTHYFDHGLVECPCGWKGKIHNLLSAQTAAERKVLPGQPGHEPELPTQEGEGS